MLIHRLPCVIQLIQYCCFLRLGDANRLLISAFADLFQPLLQPLLAPEGVEIDLRELLTLVTIHSFYCNRVGHRESLMRFVDILALSVVTARDCRPETARRSATYNLCSFHMAALAELRRAVEHAIRFRKLELGAARWGSGS